MSLHPHIEARSMPEPNSGCLLWVGACNKFGYGKTSVDGRTLGAHRVSYELHCGPIPDGLFVCHHCDVRSCVNPAHLFLGTAQDNMDDKVAKGRGRTVCGEDQPTAKLNATQAAAIFLDRRSHNAIARHYGVSRSNVSMIKSGRTWRHLGLVA